MTVLFIIHNIHKIFSKFNNFCLIYKSPVHVCVHARVFIYAYMFVYLPFSINAQLKELITVLVLSYFMKQLNI